MTDRVHPPKSPSKGFLHWLLIVLDAGLLVFLLLIYYNLFMNSASSLADILLASVSVLLTIFSLTPTVNHWEMAGRICIKLLFLGILVFIYWSTRPDPASSSASGASASDRCFAGITLLTLASSRRIASIRPMIV